MARMFTNVLGQIYKTFAEGPATDTVLDIRMDDFAKREVLARDDCLVLYNPPKTLLKASNSPVMYEVILQKPLRISASQAFSLFRTAELWQAEEKFNSLRNKLPVLMSICEISSKDIVQKLCDLIKEHRGWKIPHIAACVAFVDVIQHPKIRSELNSQCEETGVTPLHVAVEFERYNIVKLLIELGAQVDIVDFKGNTPIHLAAKTSKDFLLVLTVKDVSSTINMKNKDGYTSLHLACLADKPDCVKTLIASGADATSMSGDSLPLHTALKAGSARCAKEILERYPNQIYVKDMKNGGTLLHWSDTKEVLEAILELGSDVDAKNFDGETPLHVMVARNRLACVIVLLSFGSNPNITNKDGNTPLHLAVDIKEVNISIVQSLIAFEADLNLYNNAGFTARHLVATGKCKNKDVLLYTLHSVGAKRCRVDIPKCANGCIYEGSDNGTIPFPVLQPSRKELYEDMLRTTAQTMAISRQMSMSQGDVDRSAPPTGASKRPLRVLSLDGGGIKGLLLVQMLIHLESQLGKRLLSSFDWIIGTSTGGILALYLACGMSLRECQKMYLCMKDKVFCGMYPYDSEPFEKFLKEALGEDKYMTDIKHPKVAVTGVLADRHPAELHLFRNYPPPNSISGFNDDPKFTQPPKPEEQLIWRAARASGAAPVYFRASGAFVDGGLISNNPTMDIITEIHEYNTALTNVGRETEVRPIGCVVSLGTGRIPVIPVQAIGVYKPGGILDLYNLAKGANSLIELLIDQATQSDGRVVQRARAWCSMLKIPYFRFSPQLSSDVKMDETNDEKVIQMIWETDYYMNSKQKDVETLVQLLQQE